MKIAVIVPIVMTCAGCVSRQAHPSNWPPERATQNATDLEGVFLDGDRALRNILRPKAVLDSSVRIVAGPSTLILEFVLDDGSRKNVEMPFMIEDGWLIAKYGRGLNRDGAVGFETVTFHIRVDATGSLVVRHATRSVGTLFFIPVVGTVEYWSRLPRKPNLK